MIHEKEGPGQKKSWGELREDVRTIRRRLWTLGFRIPHSFAFKNFEDSTRIYFMCAAPNNRDNCLYAVDIPETCPSLEEHETGVVKFPWVQMLPTGFQGMPLSKAELLMLERKRMSPTGISAFDFHESSGSFVFTASSSIFQCVDNYDSQYPLVPSEIPGEGTDGARLNARICPQNPNLIAFVHDGDLWIVSSDSGKGTRLTWTAGKIGQTEADFEALSAGLPSYIMQEEFNRFDGFWWQPVSSKEGIYKILYEEVDESAVEIVSLLTLPGRDPERFRFPKPGSSNARSRLRILSFRMDSCGEAVCLKTEDFQYPLSIHFPWVEYIVRAGWTPDGNYVWAQLLDRPQRRLELVAWPVEGVETASAPAYVLLTEESRKWINVHDILMWLPSSRPETLSFIWATESTNFRHLQAVTSRLRPAISQPWHGLRTPAIHLTPCVESKQDLTFGKWEVLNGPIAVHGASATLFFMGTKDTPLERHLYCFSLNDPEKYLHRLTAPGYSYSAAFSPDATLLVLTFSNLRTQPQTLVHRVIWDGLRKRIVLSPLTYLTEPKRLDPCLQFPEIYMYKKDSELDLYAMVYKPFGFNPSNKYPIVLNIYGGPEVQLVVNSFRGTGQLWLYLMAAQGYCVVSIDSRGSHHRGMGFESHIHQRMGTVELEDQVEVLRWLVEKEPWMDIDRVGIYGWSYGGYLSLMGLAQHPSVFKVAVAGAPVTSWELYDSGYTERYMGTPLENPSGYRMGSVLHHVAAFPEETGRLLLVHGLSDENVHFTHTAELVNALVRAGKPYQLQVYPSERHSLRRLDASEHYETALLAFLQDGLKGSNN